MLNRGIIFQRMTNIRRKKIRATTNKVAVETAVEPRPTTKMAMTRKGLKVRKSKTIATTKEEAAISKEKFSLLFRT